MYYRNANCAVVVYDITQPASLEKARTWIRELQRQADPHIVIALCGNKSDLSARRQVTQEEAQKYAEEEGLMWGETSAKTGEGVQDIFMALGVSIFYLSLSTLSGYSDEANLCHDSSFIAKKLPTVAPSAAKGPGAARAGPAGAASIDLNKSNNVLNRPDNCNC